MSVQKQQNNALEFSRDKREKIERAAKSNLPCADLAEALLEIDNSAN